MNHLFRWLNPVTPLRGAAFGALLGFLSTLVILRVRWELRLPWSFYDAGLTALFGAIYAVAWAIVWGLSGFVCLVFRPYPGTPATLCAVAIGTGSALAVFPYDPRVLTAAPIFTFFALLPCHLCFTLSRIARRARRPPSTP